MDYFLVFTYLFIYNLFKSLELNILWTFSKQTVVVFGI